MARAGITKYAVEKARKSLIARAINPSIDSIRVELGNTGSKTTISRYLKELEAEESVRLDDEALLSNGIKEIIAQLASKLHQEANEVVKLSKSDFQARIDVLESENNQFKKQIETQIKELEEGRLSQELLSEQNLELNEKLSQAKDSLSDANGNTRELEAIITEKDKQINLLEENHQHTRDSLVHYRDSVKDQREQEHRQFEQQVQQLQVEIRQLNQTLIIKQNDITDLNKDNSRLVSELSVVQKQLMKVENKLSHSKSDLLITKEELRNSKDKLVVLTSKSEKLKVDYQEVQENYQVKEIELKKSEHHMIKLEALVAAKNELIRQFQPVKIGHLRT